jgi:1-pyrroline-5-carboxylate dehydrogenase
MVTAQMGHPTSLLASSFANEPFLDFSREENARKMRDAIAQVRAQFGREYEMVIGGQRLRTAGKIRSINPAHPSEVVGVHQEAGPEHAEAAIAAAWQAFERWRLEPWNDRIATILRAGEILRRRKFEFLAWVVCEAGKNWAEADGEVAESIDFTEFYTPVQLPGERDHLTYIPLGVGAVIPPWNFPLAIMGGLVMASIVCGNTVVLKPSPDSPTVAAKFLEVLEEAGVPPGVVNFCPGGAEFGTALVEHARLRYVGFTGSKAVGLQIHERAAKTQPEQIWIKRTILEMGGKDATIVEADADLDAAVEGVALAAFGYAGQKCSACSRAIVDEKVCDVFLERLRARVERMQLGDPAENRPVGPLINERAMNKAMEYIAIGKKEGRLLCGGERALDAGDGYYVQPTVIADVAPDARIAQEEVFGPLLAVIKSRGFEDALHIANGTEYGLTGAIYTSSAEKIERAKRDFHVGNLYINRKCTGALCGPHPFGGFNMSGTDSKSGGPDYLLLFTQAKSIGEKIMA